MTYSFITSLLNKSMNLTAIFLTALYIVAHAFINFLINAALFNFVLIRGSKKYVYTKSKNISYKNNKIKKKYHRSHKRYEAVQRLLKLIINQNIMISEDHISQRNCYFKMQYYFTIYYFFLYFSSTALMSRKDSLKKKKIHVYIYREPGVVIPHQTLTAAPAQALSARLCYLQQQHLQQRAEQRLHSLLEDPQRSGIGHVYSSLKKHRHTSI